MRVALGYGDFPGQVHAFQAGKSPDETAPVNKSEAIEERVMMGLRLRDGIPSNLIEEFSEKVNYINNITDFRLLELSQDRLRLTEAGRPLLNAILRELLA